MKCCKTISDCSWSYQALSYLCSRDHTSILGARHRLVYKGASKVWVYGKAF